MIARMLPANPGGLVYGTILVATLLAAESAKRETYPRTIGAVVLALIIYWLSVSYAAYTGERVREGEHFALEGFRRAATHELTVILGALVPLVVLVISWAGEASLTNAVTIAIWASVALIVVIEVAIGVRSQLTGREMVVQSAFGIMLGLLVVALRVLLH